MKSLEYCLDYILKELEKNWDGVAHERTYMVAETILRQFGLPENFRKHEFFIRLVQRLMEDGYAEIIDPGIIAPLTRIQYFQEKTIITIEGYFFIKDGGYQKDKKRKSFRKRVTQASI